MTPVELETLVVTWCFEAARHGSPYNVTVRFTGRRVTDGRRTNADQFVRDETVRGVVPGCGWVSVTTQVLDVPAGEWDVAATIVAKPQRSGSKRHRPPASTGRVRSATWSWRHWRISPAENRRVATRWTPAAPFVPRPAVVPGSWTLLVAVAVVTGVWIQRLALARLQLPTGSGLLLSLVAIVLGIFGARVWYLAQRPPGAAKSTFGAGWCIQGFVAAATLTFAVLLPLADIPVGRFFDATAPGLLIGMAIGRLGCFFTGCCGGRITASRWGVFSSDRRVGARRVPTQLLEAATSAVLGAGALAFVWRVEPRFPGTVFVGSFSAYIIVRQVLLGLRAEARRSAWRRRATLVLALATLVVDLLILVLGS